MRYLERLFPPFRHRLLCFIHLSYPLLWKLGFKILSIYSPFLSKNFLMSICILFCLIHLIWIDSFLLHIVNFAVKLFNLNDRLMCGLFYFIEYRIASNLYNLIILILVNNYFNKLYIRYWFIWITFYESKSKCIFLLNLKFRFSGKVESSILKLFSSKI